MYSPSTPKRRRVKLSRCWPKAAFPSHVITWLRQRSPEFLQAEVGRAALKAKGAAARAFKKTGRDAGAAAHRAEEALRNATQAELVRASTDIEKAKEKLELARESLRKAKEELQRKSDSLLVTPQ